MKKYKYKQKYIQDIQFQEQYAEESLTHKDNLANIALICNLVTAMNDGALPEMVSFKPWGMDPELSNRLLDMNLDCLVIVREEVENSHDMYTTNKEPV